MLLHIGKRNHTRIYVYIISFATYFCNYSFSSKFQLPALMSLSI